MYQVTVSSTISTNDAIDGSLVLYDAIIDNKAVCDDNYQFLGMASAAGRARGAGRHLLQKADAPAWCTIITGTNGAPPPFPCPNSPFYMNMTCDGPPPQSVSCTASVSRSAEVAPTGLFEVSTMRSE